MKLKTVNLKLGLFDDNCGGREGQEEQAPGRRWQVWAEATGGQTEAAAGSVKGPGWGWLWCSQLAGLRWNSA